MVQAHIQQQQQHQQQQQQQPQNPSEDAPEQRNGRLLLETSEAAGGPGNSSEC